MTLELTTDEAYARVTDEDLARVIHYSEYESSKSESLTFLYNLLYDENSSLTKADILNILNSLKERENTLPFAFTTQKQHLNVQGVNLPSSLRRRFYEDRTRIGNLSWFQNVPQLRADAIKVCELSRGEFPRYSSFL